MSATRTVILASRNRGKAREFERLFQGVFRVEPLPTDVRLPEETGRTFTENARLKAEAVFAALGGEAAVLADDSGLEVAALDGRPGVRSARYAGDAATDDDNVGKLLREMASETQREARFVCALCLLLPGGAASSGPSAQRIEVEGSSSGTITDAPRGTDGFGYDPVFQPLGWTITLAEADPRDKDLVSHRGAAARALLERLAAGEGDPDAS